MLKNKIIGLNDGLKKGSEKHFRKFYEFTCGVIYGICLKFGLSVEDAEEVVQDTYVVFWKQRHAIDPDKNVINLLKIIAKRMIYKKIKRKKTSVHILALSEEMTELPPIDKTELDVKSHLLLHGAIKKLPPTQAEVIKLFYLQNLSVSEISEYKSVSKRTIENNLYRARKRLTDIFNTENISMTSFFINE